MTSREPCTILIVDDDSDIRSLLSLLLKGDGYYVDVASDGEEALSILRGTLKPCLVMLDLMMPGMSGCELLEIISKDATLNAIPVVVASAIPALAKPYASNVKSFLTKPFSVDAILSVVRENCTEHQHSVLIQLGQGVGAGGWDRLVIVITRKRDQIVGPSKIWGKCKVGSKGTCLVAVCRLVLCMTCQESAQIARDEISIPPAWSKSKSLDGRGLAWGRQGVSAHRHLTAQTPLALQCHHLLIFGQNLGTF